MINFPLFEIFALLFFSSQNPLPLSSIHCVFDTKSISIKATSAHHGVGGQPLLSIGLFPRCLFSEGDFQPRVAAESPAVSETSLCCTLACFLSPPLPRSGGLRATFTQPATQIALSEIGSGLLLASVLKVVCCVWESGSPAAEGLPCESAPLSWAGPPRSVGGGEGNLKPPSLSCDLGSIDAISMLTSAQESRNGSSPTGRTKRRDSGPPTEKPTVLLNHLQKTKESAPRTPPSAPQVQRGGRKVVVRGESVRLWGLGPAAGCCGVPPSARAVRGGAGPSPPGTRRWL